MLMLLGCCTTIPFIEGPSENLKIIPGGIGDVRPYFGDLRLVTSDDSEAVFLLASCGCGDWRVLIQPHDGSPQEQFAIHFYNESGDYADPGDVLAYGKDETLPAEFSAILQQDPGLLDGRVINGDTKFLVSAVRGDAHATVTACGMCHLGDNPIHPLPAEHPTKYLTDPTVCLECHTAG